MSLYRCAEDEFAKQILRINTRNLDMFLKLFSFIQIFAICCCGPQFEGASTASCTYLYLKRLSASQPTLYVENSSIPILTI